MESRFHCPGLQYTIYLALEVENQSSLLRLFHLQ
jgi:hypothetical protein